MKKLPLFLSLILLATVSHAKPLDVDNIFNQLDADREIIRHDFENTSKLMDTLHKKNLISATDLMNAIDNVLERTASEGVILGVYNRVTNDEAQAEAEKIIRKHYADLAKLTAVDVESAHRIARDCKPKELAALASKVEADIQKIADRYEALSKE